MTSAALDTRAVRRWKRYAEYRHLHAETLNALPSHWRLSRVKHSTWINPEVLRDDTSADYELQYIDISNVDSHGRIGEHQTFRFEDAPSRARRRVRHGDVLISTVRTYLRAIASIKNPPDNLVVSTGFAVVRAGKEFDPRYLWRLAQSNEFVDMVVNHSEGVGYPAISPGELGKLPVWLPPLPEQRAISAFLDRETARIDELIGHKERLIALLEEKRQAVISHAVTRGLDPAAPLKDSGVPWIGMVPKHWETRRLKHISPEQLVGLVINPSTYVDEQGDIPFLFGSNVVPGGFSLDGVRRITAESNRLISNSMLRTGDLVTVRVGAPGVTAVIPSELDGCNCASIMITRRGARFDSQWLCYAMNSSVGKTNVQLAQYGAAQEQFNISDAVNFWFAVPPLEEQIAIAQRLHRHCESVAGAVGRIRDGIARLHEYRTALISAAVTGQIDVRDEV